MCGRFTHRYTWAELHRLLRLVSPPIEPLPRYNVAPTQLAPVVRAVMGVSGEPGAAGTGAGGGRTLGMLRWGLIPSWANDERIGASLINARAEGIESKPSFRAALTRRRCIVPVSGFYEWQPPPPHAATTKLAKQPYYIHAADESEPLLLAGLWESWRPPAGGETVETFTVITTTPNEVMAPLHNRMPVILDEEGVDRWLAPGPTSREDVPRLLALLRPCAAERLVTRAVSARVNSPRNDDVGCVAGVEVRRGEGWARDAPEAGRSAKRRGRSGRSPANEQRGLFGE
jgi:putative SOS response-associated peptidase YedK